MICMAVWPRAYTPDSLRIINVIKITVILCSRFKAQHRHVLIMITIVNAPAVMSTISYRCLITDTLHVVQPYGPAAWSISISNCQSSVPKINNIIDLGLTSRHDLY